MQLIRMQRVQVFSDWCQLVSHHKIKRAWEYGAKLTESWLRLRPEIYKVSISDNGFGEDAGFVTLK